MFSTNNIHKTLNPIKNAKLTTSNKKELNERNITVMDLKGSLEKIFIDEEVQTEGSYLFNKSNKLPSFRNISIGEETIGRFKDSFSSPDSTVETKILYPSSYLKEEKGFATPIKKPKTKIRDLENSPRHSKVLSFFNTSEITPVKFRRPNFTLCKEEKEFPNGAILLKKSEQSEEILFPFHQESKKKDENKKVIKRKKRVMDDDTSDEDYIDEKNDSQIITGNSSNSFPVFSRAKERKSATKRKKHSRYARRKIKSGIIFSKDIKKRFGSTTKNSLKSVALLQQWVMSHLRYPYPTKSEKTELMKSTGLTLTQISNWCSNYRKRIWRPAIKDGLNEESKKKKNSVTDQFQTKEILTRSKTKTTKRKKQDTEAQDTEYHLQLPPKKRRKLQKVLEVPESNNTKL